MPTLKPYQVAAAAMLGGFPPGEIPNAVAVAKGESSYRTDLYNGSCCYGLWQVHKGYHEAKVKKYGGSWEAYKNPVVNAKVAHEIWSTEGGWCRTKNPPHCNPYEAYGKNDANGTWKSKLAEGARAYAEVQQRQARGETLQQMVGATATLADFKPQCLLPNYALTHPDECFGVGNDLLPGAGDIADAAGAIAGMAQALIDFGNRIGGWVGDPQSWIRVVQVVGGGLLVAMGLRIAFHKQVMSVGKDVVQWVVPGGKGAKFVAKAKTASAAKGAAA